MECSALSVSFTIVIAIQRKKREDFKRISPLQALNQINDHYAIKS